jgi:biopolymer transport protein ExbB
LVEIYGDEGGASMLAGSISKALITTAIGLIIAIPTLGIYHAVKYRLNCLGDLLEEELEALLNAWLLTDEVNETSDNDTH